MLWINFLHLYQPSNADAHVIKEATEKSYYRIIRALEEHPRIKFTLNITGCLFYRWEELGYLDLIQRLGKLIKRGQVELVGTVAYHPIMPLISKKEIISQIKENQEITQKFFGENFKPKGFFLPEMAYGAEVGKIIKDLGYEWIILDEISYNGKLGEVEFNKIYKDKKSKLKIIFRSRELSKSFVPDTIAKIVNQNKVAITATDGEIYGLRHIDHTANFEKLLKNPKLQTLTISKYIATLKIQEEISLVPSNWESTEKELKENTPYGLWINKKNKVQKMIWELADFASQTAEKYKNDKNYYWARWHLVRGLASCTFWWASAKDFKLFGSISWSPDEIERGTNEFIRSIRAIENKKSRVEKIKAEKLYIKIKQTIWKIHWAYYWKK